MKRSDDDDDDCVIDYAYRPSVIPEGEYDAVYVRHETAMVFNTPKVFVWFRVVSPGPGFEREFYRAFRAQALTSKAGRGGKFKLKAGSDLTEMLVRLSGAQRRLDRVSLSAVLKGPVLRIRIRTVTENSKKVSTPEALRYSVVDDVLSKETGPKANDGIARSSEQYLKAVAVSSELYPVQHPHQHLLKTPGKPCK